MVTDRERDYLWHFYAANSRARINLGIRRRLAPLLERDRRKIELLNSLLMSMPGTPIIYYGDEIGMGDNVFLGDRNGVRTPMQWSPDRNAGFSKAEPEHLYLPPIMDSVFGYEAVNVEAQERDRSSLLHWMRRMLRVRSVYRSFGRGTLRLLRPGNRKILAYLRQHGDETLLCVTNLGRNAQAVELNLGEFKGRVPVEIIGEVSFPPIGELPYMLTLPGHAFYWFRLASDAASPPWHMDHLPREDLPALVLFDGWNSFFRERVVPWRIRMAEQLREQLERDVLPRFLASRRWYTDDGVESLPRVAMVDAVEWGSATARWLFAIVEATAGELESVRYPAAPVAGVGGRRCARDADRARRAGPGARACARRADARRAARRALPARHRRGDRPGRRTARRARPHPLHADERLWENCVAAYKEVDLTASAARFEIEHGDHAGRSAVPQGLPPDRAGYQYPVRDRAVPDRKPCRSITLPRSPAPSSTSTSPGASRHSRCYSDTCRTRVAPGTARFDCARFLDDVRSKADADDKEAHSAYLEMIGTLGTRTAGLHLALATPTGDPAFDPRPINRADLRRWSRAGCRKLAAAASRSSSCSARRGRPLPCRSEALLRQRDELLRAMQNADPAADRHQDAPSRRLRPRAGAGNAQRFRDRRLRARAAQQPPAGFDSPLRDVAGLVRSLRFVEERARAGARHDEAPGRPLRAGARQSALECARPPALPRLLRGGHARAPAIPRRRPIARRCCACSRSSILHDVAPPPSSACTPTCCTSRCAACSSCCDDPAAVDPLGATAPDRRTHGTGGLLARDGTRPRPAGRRFPSRSCCWRSSCFAGKDGWARIRAVRRAPGHFAPSISTCSRSVRASTRSSSATDQVAQIDASGIAGAAGLLARDPRLAAGRLQRRRPQLRDGPASHLVVFIPKAFVAVLLLALGAYF